MKANENGIDKNKSSYNFFCRTPVYLVENLIVLFQ